MDDHAQQEIQDYAKVMYEMVKPEVPIATEAFEDYIYNSSTLSRMEMNVLKYVFDNFPLMQHSSGYCQNIISYMDEISKEKDFGLSKREWVELKEKINI
jgi:thymidylate synthase ThyX|tara:strand:- start:728 stop:1024 length:297 start_codon:yes stop_codon:yes gene_type:complete